MRPLVVIALVSLAGCVTPSIPIPPPDPSEMTVTIMPPDSNAAGTGVLSYPPNDQYNAGTAYVFNDTIGSGVIQRISDDGSFMTQPFPAVVGNQVVVSITTNQQTVSTCVVLRDGQQSSTDYCQ